MLQSVTECLSVLQSITEYIRVLQNITEYYRLFLAHLLGPISGLVESAVIITSQLLELQLLPQLLSNPPMLLPHLLFACKRETDDQQQCQNTNIQQYWEALIFNNNAKHQSSTTMPKHLASCARFAKLWSSRRRRIGAHESLFTWTFICTHDRNWNLQHTNCEIIQFHWNLNSVHRFHKLVLEAVQIVPSNLVRRSVTEAPDLYF